MTMKMSSKQSTTNLLPTKKRTNTLMQKMKKTKPNQSNVGNKQKKQRRISNETSDETNAHPLRFDAVRKQAKAGESRQSQAPFDNKEASSSNKSKQEPHASNKSASTSGEKKAPSRGKLVEFSDNEEDLPLVTQVSSTEQKPSTTAASSASATGQKTSLTSSSLLDKYRKKLEGAKFRLLNESLYTGEKQSTGLSQGEFAIYHQGFARQVEKWPTNPVDEIIKRYINPKKRKISIGDFGCGDAKIAHLKGKQHNIHSFDLVAADESVTACDIARDGVPLGDESLDMVIFSLSLMGSDVTSYIAEARRVLRVGGELIIAEVKSRFSDEGEKSTEAFNRGLNKFCNGLKGRGFKMIDLDTESNTHFVLIRLSKSSHQPVNEKVRITLKACEYKRR